MADTTPLDNTSDAVGNRQVDLDGAMQQHDEAASQTGSVKGRWATTAVGVGIAGYGLSQKSASGAGLALVGAGIAYLGATGKLPMGAGAPGGDGSVRVEQTITINKPPSEVYAFWRDFANLPRFMTHLESVTSTGAGKSHWVAKAPLGKTVEWDAEIINEEPGRLIAWRSLHNADIHNTGSVRFEPAPGGRGTELRLRIEYAPPAGVVGAAVAKLFGEEPSMQTHDDLRRLKSFLEAGEIPTTDGQPRGGAGGQSKLDDLAQHARQLLAPAQDALSGTSPSGS
jgi:uncharacterized membrane protein